jgi:uncharacterized RDD family membrane protein YckC
MSYGTPFADEYLLTEGVLTRRCLAWVIDVLVIAMLVWVLWWVLVMFGLLTLGLGFAVVGILPWVPFLYQFLSLLGSTSATPGQRIMGLAVRRFDDLGPPSALQALVFVVVFYVTMATSGLLLVVALVTSRNRTLHDLLSGLVVVRTRALTAMATGWNMPGGTFIP